MASELGISQQAISKIEQSAEVEDDALARIAKVLGVTPEAIKNFSEEAVVNYFNTFNDNSTNNGAVYAFNSTFNPIDKLIEVYEENKKLYEQLLASEKEISARCLRSGKFIFLRLYRNAPIKLLPIF